MPDETGQIYTTGNNAVPDYNCITTFSIETQTANNVSSGTTKSSCFKPLHYVIFCSALASFGGILFGYDIGIISGALLQLKRQFFLTCFEQEMVVSSVLMGSFVASFFGGIIVDKYGRRFALMLTSVTFILGAITLSLSMGLLGLLVSRFVIGIAISISVTAECAYISEISPPKYRGMLVSLNEVGITVGFLLAYLVNFLFISHDDGWKYMFGIGALPACVLLLGAICLPPSPYFLLLKNNTEKAYNVLQQLRGTENVENELAEIISALQETKKEHCCELCTVSNNMRFRIAIGMILVFLQQATGQTNVLYYAPTIFQYFGFCSNTAATLASIGLGVIKVVAACAVALLIDHIGRRCLLLSGAATMAVSILILGIITMTTSDRVFIMKCDSVPELPPSVKNIAEENSFANIAENVTDTNSLNASSSGTHLHSLIVAESHILPYVLNDDNFNTTHNTKSNNERCSHVLNVPIYLKVLSVIFLMAYVCAYEMSFASVTWLLLNEIFPSYIRGRAVSVATSLNWGTNIIMSAFFLDLLGAIGIGESFLIYAGICFASVIFVYYVIPETKNKNLEEISQELSKQKPSCCVTRPRTFRISRPTDYHTLEESSH